MLTTDVCAGACTKLSPLGLPIATEGRWQLQEECGSCFGGPRPQVLPDGGDTAKETFRARSPSSPAYDARIPISESTAGKTRPVTLQVTTCATHRPPSPRPFCPSFIPKKGGGELKGPRRAITIQLDTDGGGPSQMLCPTFPLSRVKSQCSLRAEGQLPR